MEEVHERPEINKDVEMDEISTIQNLQHIQEVEMHQEKLNYDQSTQTNIDNLFISNMLNTDEKLKYFTNINYQTLAAIEECVKEVAASNNEVITDLILKIIVTLVKLKLNISFACIAILFKISNSTCTRYFYQTVSVLAVALKPAIYWLTKEEIKLSLPKCFRSFSNTRNVLDCTEIKVDKSNCLKCKILTYSHYKGQHSIKYLIVITPSGLILTVVRVMVVEPLINLYSTQKK